MRALSSACQTTWKHCCRRRTGKVVSHENSLTLQSRKKSVLFTTNHSLRWVVVHAGMPFMDATSRELRTCGKARSRCTINNFVLSFPRCKLLAVIVTTHLHKIMPVTRSPLIFDEVTMEALYVILRNARLVEYRMRRIWFPGNPIAKACRAFEQITFVLVNFKLFVSFGLFCRFELFINRNDV